MDKARAPFQLRHSGGTLLQSPSKGPAFTRTDASEPPRAAGPGGKTAIWKATTAPETPAGRVPPGKRRKPVFLPENYASVSCLEPCGWCGQAVRRGGGGERGVDQGRVREGDSSKCSQWLEIRAITVPAARSPRPPPAPSLVQSFPAPRGLLAVNQ